MAIGAGWVDGSWVDAGWVTEAWADDVAGTFAAIHGVWVWDIFS